MQIISHSLWIKTVTWLGLTLLGAIAPTLVQGQIVLGQVNTFTDGTTDGWTDGNSPANSVNVATGGPNGLNDRYLQISSGTFGGHAKLISFNDTQWTGNYTAAGVSFIGMQLRNFGTSTLPIRIAIDNSGHTPSIPGYASTVPFMLPADGQWHQAVFAVNAADLTPFNSPASPVLSVLNDVFDFRVLSSASPSTTGDILNAQIGVDNVTALGAAPVPEPASVVLAAFACAAGVALKRRRQIR